MAEPQDAVSLLLRRLSATSRARIGLGRAGQGLPTRETLAFRLAHAQARDAVAAGLDTEALRQRLDEDSVIVSSAAADRTAYLKDPGAGRRLDDDSRERLQPGDYDVAVVIADGLSAVAANSNALPVYAELRRIMDGAAFAPVIFAHLARVALGDEIGERLGARSIVMLIGERPGLSSADSLGAYITRSPRKGRADSERNCISNIRPDGLSHEQAARNIAWILKEAERIGETGIALKDRRDRRTLSQDAG